MTINTIEVSEQSCQLHRFYEEIQADQTADDQIVGPSRTCSKSSTTCHRYAQRPDRTGNIRFTLSSLVSSKI